MELAKRQVGGSFLRRSLPKTPEAMVQDLPAEFGRLQERLDGAEVRVLRPVSAVRNPGREKTK